MSSVTYLNNAATSFPKPACVVNHVYQCLNKPSSDSTRACNCNKKSSDSDIICKTKLRKFFKLSNDFDIIFTSGATHAFNCIVNHLINDLGIKKCYCTQQEHNSVYRTVHQKFKTVNFLNYINKDMVDVSVAEEDSCIFLNHECNVDGNLLDIKKILSDVYCNNIPVIVDITQSAGTFDINLLDWDHPNLYVVCSTHKGLMSLEALGFFTKPNHVKFSPFMLGGTGKNSYISTKTESLEVGTQNSIAIESLNRSIDYINDFGLDYVRYIKKSLVEYYFTKIKYMKNYELYNQLFITNEDNTNYESGIISLKVNSSKANMFVESLKSKNIIIRHGLHCSPVYHINILKCESTIRISFGIMNSKHDIDNYCAAADEILSNQHTSYTKSLLS